MNQSAKLAIGLILAGIILTELILFIQGTMLWNVMGFMPYYYEVLFGVSILIPVGILWYGIGLMRENN